MPWFNWRPQGICPLSLERDIKCPKNGYDHLDLNSFFQHIGGQNMLQVWTKLINDWHCWFLIGEILLRKGKPKKFQGYDDVGYKQINKFVAQNMVIMDPWLQAYEDTKEETENALQK